jgi:3-hydroxyisobutyrate dehydrogenase
VGEGADVVLLSLPDGAVVRDVLLGEGDLAARLAAGAVVVDLSSSAPSGTVELGARLAERGIALLDAPVSGGVARARTGELAMMVGGEAAVLDRVRPVLATLATRVFATGRLGSGHALKALNNYVSATGLLAALEAIDVAARFEIDPELALEVLNASSGRNNSTESKVAQFVLSGSYGSGFALGLMAKDLRLARALAEELGAPAGLLEASSALWDRGSEAVPAATDHTAIGRALGLDAGSADPA